MSHTTVSINRVSIVATKSSNIENDMLLMSGFLCHKCLPDNCRDGGIYPTSKGTCSNIIGKGYKCTCDEGSYGDHCQHREADRPKNISPPPPPPPPVVASGGVFDVAPYNSTIMKQLIPETGSHICSSSHWLRRCTTP